MSRVRDILWLATGRGVPGDHMGEPDTYKGHQIPAYSVERRLGPVEIRAYPQTLVAETTVDGDGDAALREGFRRLAGYIFGGNEGSRRVAMTAPVDASPQKIAMTAPVDRQTGSGGVTVRFTLPRDLTAETAPRPKDARVRIRTAPPERRAVLRFSGLSGAARMAEQAEKLRVALRQAGLDWREPALEMRYDDPMTAPWNRRNEVAFALA